MIDETTKFNRAQGYYKRIALAGDTTGAFKQLVAFNKEADNLKNLINQKYGSGTIKYGSEIPQPPARPEVIEMDLINDFMKRNPAADGGQMVKPSADGSRPGYSGVPGQGKKKITDFSKDVQQLIKDYGIEKYNKLTLAQQSDVRRGINVGIGQGKGPRVMSIDSATGTASGRTIEQQKKLKKSEKIKSLTKTILKQNSKIKNGYKVLKIIPGSVGSKTKNTIYQKVLTAAGGKDKVNVINLSKVFNEIVKNEGYLSPNNYRRQIIVDLFMDDYANNGQFTGEAKLDPRLAEFKGPKKQLYTGINKTFREWANGDFEVDGFDRSTFDEITKKNLKNWKPIDNVNDRRIQVRKELKFLNNLNDTKPNLSGDEVKKLFTKEFKNSPYWRDTSFVNRITQLYPHKIYGQGRDGTTVEGINKGNRSSWLQKSYAESKSGNFSRALIAADRAEANGDLQLAKKFRKAGKDLFMLKTGAISKIPGQAEHPWFHNYGKGLFQIDSIVKGDLNYFKRQNFEIPIRNLITEYELKTKPPTLARKKAIEAEINLRRRFLNTITDIGDGGMARNVTFDYKSNPGTIKVINKTPDIYKQYLSGRLDPLELQTRGTSYRDTLIKNLTEADYNILKKGTDEIKTGKIGSKTMENLIKSIGCPNVKAGGGRIEFSTGGNCFDKGQKLINNGMKGASPAQLKNLSKLGPMLLKAGSAVMSGLIVPEALIVGLDAAARVGLGDTPAEAILRATDYITPDSYFGNFLQKADLMKIERTLGKDVKNIAAQSFARTDQSNKINKLEKKLKNLEAMSESSEFGYVGDLTNQINMTKDQIKKEKEDLKNKFTTTGQESRDIYTERAFEDAYDASMAKSKFAAKNLVDSQSENPRIRASQDMQDMISQKKLNEKKIDSPKMKPNLGAFVNFDDRQLELLAARTGQDLNRLRQIQDYLNQERKLSFAEQEKIFGKELTYGTQGHMGQPIEREGPGYYSNYNPSDRYKNFKLGMFSEGGITTLRSKYEYKK